MDITSLVGLSLTATVFLLLLRQLKPEMAVLFGIAFGLFMFWRILEPLKLVLDTLEGLTEQAGIEVFYLGSILKILGIAYLAEFASVLAADAGEKLVAKKVEFAAKVLIAALALPVMTSVLDMLYSLLAA